MAEVIARNCRFHTQTLGKQGERVVFLHGLVWDNLSSWYFSVAPHVAKAAQVLMYDARGHGKSERTPDGYRIEDMVADLDAILGETGFSESPVHLVGNSFGGLVAVAYAQHHPDKVASLTLLDAHLADDEMISMMKKTLLLKGTERDREITQLFSDWLGRQTDPENTTLAKEAGHLVYETTLVDDLENSRHFSEDELRKIIIPTLALYGENSNLLPQGKRLTSLLPNSRLRVLDGGSHVILWEFSNEIAQQIVTWVQTHGQSMKNQA